MTISERREWGKALGAAAIALLGALAMAGAYARVAAAEPPAERANRWSTHNEYVNFETGETARVNVVDAVQELRELRLIAWRLFLLLPLMIGSIAAPRPLRAWPAVCLGVLWAVMVLKPPPANAEPPAGAGEIAEQADALRADLVDVVDAALEAAQQAGDIRDKAQALQCADPVDPVPCPPPGYELVPIVTPEPEPPPGLPEPVGRQVFGVDFVDGGWTQGDAKPQFDRSPLFGWTAIQQGVFVFAQHPLGGLALGSAVNPTTSQAGKAMSTVELTGARGPVGPGDVVTVRAAYYFGGDQRITRVTVFDLENSGTGGNDGLRYQAEDATVILDRTKLRLRGMQTNFKAPATVPKGRWFTLTWEVTVGEGFDGRSRAWIDGELVQDLEVQTTRAGLQFDRLQFGLTARLREYGPLEMWTRELGVWWEDN